VRAYIRHDPRMAEEKLAAGWSLAQVGALVMLQEQAEQQPERGRFKSMALLAASMDCMVEEHGPKARASQHVPFLMERGEIVKLDAGGYYVDGWDEFQEGDHSPQARMELVRGRRGRPGDPGSKHAKRQREYRARQSVTNHVTNPNSDASPDEPTSDGNMVADSDASPVPRARQEQEQKAIAVAVADPPTVPPRGQRNGRFADGELERDLSRFLTVLSEATGRPRRGGDPSTRVRGLYFERRQDYSADDLVAAARGVPLSKHHMGHNKLQVPLNDAAHVLGSEMLDALIGLGRGEIGAVQPMTNGEVREAELDAWVVERSAQQARELPDVAG
jgi:hypothetical protein